MTWFEGEVMQLRTFFLECIWIRHQDILCFISRNGILNKISLLSFSSTLLSTKLISSVAPLLDVDFTVRVMSQCSPRFMPINCSQAPKMTSSTLTFYFCLVWTQHSRKTRVKYTLVLNFNLSLPATKLHKYNKSIQISWNICFFCGIKWVWRFQKE